MSVQMKQGMDPWRNAARDVLLKGELPLAEFSRLLPELDGDTGSVEYSLQFYKDEARRACVEGEISVVFPLICQRCLGKLDYKVTRDVRLSFVSGMEQADRLPEDLDPVLVEDELIPLLVLLEDELILTLPNVPTHENINCNGQVEAISVEEVIPDEDKPDNPFAVLASLKAESDKKKD